MFDVGDLAVLTYGNCVLKTGVIKYEIWSVVICYYWSWSTETLIAIRYDTRTCFKVRSKADVSQLNLPHGTELKNW